MTETEQALIAPLRSLRTSSRTALAAMFARGLGPTGNGEAAVSAALQRLRLDAPASVVQRLMAVLVRGALRRSLRDGG